MLLEEIHSPSDIKKLSLQELTVLAAEMREEIIKTVARHGGHLASNLGVVELTLALHYVFDCPEDKLVFDVGHQCYAHKMLTGRFAALRDTLREEGGVSGFPRVSESECDAFTAGHASTAISAALGMARTRDVMGDDYHVVAVVGDGALTGGMCYEALNDAGQSGTRMIVILNENEMSISRNVGALSGYLTGLRQSRTYRAFKRGVRQGLERIPGVGAPMFRFVERFRDWLKTPFVDGKFFDALGFRYIGPVDGHDLKRLIRFFQRAREEKDPQILHVVTTKGKGYVPAESHPDAYHGVAPFLVETGEQRGDQHTACGRVAAAELAALAENDIRICAVTAAMPTGTGMEVFGKAHPKRFYDVGIAEEHAVTMAAGMAASGMKPYVAVYSTFLQRAFDQISTDVCINALPVTFLIDRAGLVGADGVTHQGVFDLSYLAMLPNMVVAAPRDVRDLKRLIRLSAEYDGPMAIRYPKDGEDLGARLEAQKPLRVGEWELLSGGEDVLFFAVGRMVQPAMNACIALMHRGVRAGVVDARFVKPMDEDMLRASLKTPLWVTVEENVLSGGLGERVLAWLAKNAPGHAAMTLAVPDRFIEHAPVSSQLRQCGLDAEGLTASVLGRLGR